VNYARALLPRRPGGTLPTARLGRTGVRVDRDHLARYDRVCGFRLTDSLPATYPHVLAFGLAMRLMTAAGFPFPVAGLVHVANRITVHRPLGADSPLDLAVHATDLRPHRRGRQFDLVATAAVDGEQVWHGVSTYLRKEPAAAPVATETPPAPVDGRAGARWRIPARTGRDYAAVSGDRNPIHTSRLGARLFGFPGPIAHGMWSKARCLAALEGRLPERYTVDVTFRQPIPLPATVSFVASPVADGWRFGLESGRPHLAGTVTRP
jgi:acyl dehydratase